MNPTEDPHEQNDPDAGLLRRFVGVSGAPLLLPSFVCMLDLLGTSEGSLEEAQRNLAITHDALERASRWSNELGDQVLTRWYTDNVLIAAPEDAEGVWDLSSAAVVILAASVQFELAMRGLFARGAIERGEFFANRRFLYGPALTRAHHLEERVAVVPRVVLSYKTAHAVATEVSSGNEAFPVDAFTELLAIDHDGEAFVNYLGIARDIGATNVLDDLQRHRDHILAALQHHRHEDRIRAKLGWVADYHDRFCRSIAGPGDLEEVVVRSTEGPTLRRFDQAHATELLAG